MNRRESAGDRFPRIVELVARLRGRGRRPISELAAELGVSEDQIRSDVQELLGRIYYRPGGWIEDIQVFLDGDTLEIPRASTFQRPPRLSASETLCLALALRTAVAQSFHGDATRLERMLDTAQQYLAGTTWTHETLETVLAADLAPDAVGIRQALIRASRKRTPCTITYLKPAQEQAETRTIHPWSLVHAGGAWHVIAWCTMREDMRQFRLDRILDVALEEGRFEVPENFDPASELPSLQLKQDGRATPVRVRYREESAPWVREDARRRGFPWTDLPDGGVEILHSVGDMAWLLHHILSVAPSAEVVDPPEVRALIAEVARDLMGPEE